LIDRCINFRADAQFSANPYETRDFHAGFKCYSHHGRVGEDLSADLRTASVGRILVIENDKALRKIIWRALVSEGYEVEFVANGAIALELVRQKRLSALIVDLQFPGFPGGDLCKKLMQAAPAIPFVVLSASPSIADKVLFLEMGADDYIAIPFSPEELVARLHALRRRWFRFISESFYAFGDVMVGLYEDRSRPWPSADSAH
jgi:CheY-like chemotaxis protein